MQKQTIIVIINDLQRGGAETLLVGILPELNERYDVVLVTLREFCDFREDEIVYTYRYNLGVNSRLSVLKGVFKLKSIIRRHKPTLIHAHLAYGSLIARMACPADIPLIYTLHDTLSSHFNRYGILTLLEKKTTRSNCSIIAVSNEVLLDYERSIKKVKNSFILDNYIADVFTQQKVPYKDLTHLNKLKLIAVGNIRAQKNYKYLIQAFTYLKQYPVTLDIYGKKMENLFESLQKEITAHQLPIVFKGKTDNIQEVLLDYDVYVMSSRHEGFGLAVAEAMAMGLPLLISDLPVLHSVTFNNALFFDIADPLFFVNRIKEIFEGKYNLNKLSARGIELAKEHYTKKVYLQKLFTIYDQVSSRSVNAALL
jgi:glycosyltransferase involved in cell wall biosynthesis